MAAVIAAALPYRSALTRDDQHHAMAARTRQPQKAEQAMARLILTQAMQIDAIVDGKLAAPQALGGAAVEPGGVSRR